MSDVLTEKPRNGWSAPCDNADGGVAILSLGAVTGFIYRPTEHKRTSEATMPGAHYWLSPGDLLVTRSNTEQLLGHAAIYSGDVHDNAYRHRSRQSLTACERVRARRLGSPCDLDHGAGRHASTIDPCLPRCSSMATSG